ncbi:ATP-binding cassette domain-containing protein [Sulfurisphaera ohwakuensis]|uniref:Molybdate/tungstate import ATP-binding protein WtpC n=1 Tax=Sulfurisphaera ohwakuensis TaxID=69656 RepID=A0A650CIN4_SULOH|nr:ATP-binding cassette domain-containing protein [Sulfurisphaera ohwakuensis]MBB5253350.1 molybdate/tungstate transport system ATP-binding protein [Sulfurisphaera ohwakuensis]QGR17672.1 ATP-binding cassette domain-containing protein [Sulfurisphaera ohwakuensis]
MLEAEVEKRYSGFALNIQFKDKGIISIIGKNGSGKTTFLKILSGIIQPDRGYVKLDGRDITNLPINKRNIVLVNQETYIPNFNVRKHLVWGAKIRKIKVDEKEIIEIAKMLDVPINENKKVGQLSLGNKEKVSLATAIIARPRVILVDEGFSNINNKRNFIRNYINLARIYGIDIIYVTQDIEDTKLAEKTYMMENGSLKSI